MSEEMQIYVAECDDEEPVSRAKLSKGTTMVARQLVHCPSASLCWLYTTAYPYIGNQWSFYERSYCQLPRKVVNSFFVDLHKQGHEEQKFTDHKTRIKYCLEIRQSETDGIITTYKPGTAFTPCPAKDSRFSQCCCCRRAFPFKLTCISRADLCLAAARTLVGALLLSILKFTSLWLILHYFLLIWGGSAWTYMATVQGGKYESVGWRKGSNVVCNCPQ